MCIYIMHYDLILLLDTEGSAAMKKVREVKSRASTGRLINRYDSMKYSRLTPYLSAGFSRLRI